MPRSRGKMSMSSSSFTVSRRVRGGKKSVPEHIRCFICNQEIIDMYNNFGHVSQANAQNLCEMFKLPPEFNRTPLIGSGSVLFCLTCGMKVQSFNVMLVQLNALLTRMEDLRQEVAHQLVQSAAQHSVSYLNALRHSLYSQLLSPDYNEPESVEEPSKTPPCSPEIDQRIGQAVVVKAEPVDEDQEHQTGNFLPHPYFYDENDQDQDTLEPSNDDSLTFGSTMTNFDEQTDFDGQRQGSSQVRSPSVKRKVVHEKKFFCDSCDRSFSSANILQGHNASFHQGNHPHTCGECGKGFGSRGNLRSHIIGVHRKQKPFSCPKCSSSFSLKGNLKTHMRIHDEIKPFSCNACGKQFSQSISLVRHNATTKYCRAQLDMPPEELSTTNQL